MGDMGDLYRDLHAEERQRAEKRKAENLAILRASVIPFEYRNGGDVVLIRNRAYPSIDFYPTKNKWRVGTRYVLGSAQALLDWLRLRAMK